MRSLKKVQIYLSFLIAFGTPSYLLYDVRSASDVESETLNAIVFVLGVCCLSGALFLLLKVKGKTYGEIKLLWERPLALIFLGLTLPFLLVIAILIKLESRGPAIYKQERIGRNRRKRDRRGEINLDTFDRRNRDRRKRDFGGAPFIIYKLRSMADNAEKEIGAAWSTGDSDPRVTRVGHFIRKTHLDELPQLYNVLLGQMSFIGPRPERPAFIDELSRVITDYRDRLKVLPGITGLAQVHQEHDESLEDVKKKLEFDRQYIRNSSLLFDIYIVAQTLILVLQLLVSSVSVRPARKAAPKTLDLVISGTTHPGRG
jgi:lipopolysaccharide/colanic/teichoic acid biosynthesis glycosyltransferase